MGDSKAFLTIHRKEAGYRPVHDRIHDFGEVEQTLNSSDRRQQASRCMDCGVPFCHWACPLGNRPPEWNDALYRGDWELAYRLLNSTNDFPEFTGRVCPALCEKACVLNLVEHEPTTNREDEAAITEHAFEENYVRVHHPKRNGKSVAVIGSGPAGLVAANQLNLKGYAVTVFDKNEDAGGLLRYGIPNFKLNKAVIDRRLLNSTNDFPEFTGRVCPALCEKACVLNLVEHEPTTNREDEAAITEHAFEENYVRVHHPKRNGKSVAVIGSGPAGLVAANQLNLKGYAVTVFDKNEDAGGLLRYGIPNFKLNKAVIDRRMNILQAEGIEFRFNTPVDLTHLPDGFDACIVATGTPEARDLDIPGRNLKGVYLALDMLAQQNRILAGAEIPREKLVNAKGKDVLVIGGGDTGSDCIGTAWRQGCRSVTQIEIMPKPVDAPDDPQHPWPEWPRTLKTTSSHEEGCTRRWNINTLRFVGKDGKVVGAEVQEIVWKPDPESGRPVMEPVGKPEMIKADMILLAMGFLKPKLPEFAPNVFVAGDAASGASLVVRAMASGRDVAAQVHKYLLTE